MLACITQRSRRQFSVKRVESFGRSLDFRENRGVARGRIGDSVTTVWIGCQDPEHGAARAFTRIVFEIALVPLRFSEPVVAIDADPKFTKDQRLSERVSGRDATANEVTQSNGRINKTI